VVTRKPTGGDHWAATIPCTRHGESGIRDERLIELFEAAQRSVATNLAAHVRSLHDFNGQLWVTWKNNVSRTEFAPVIDQNWRALGETGPTIHLIPVDDSYDYQEDVINNADRDL
jgi:hypothetical protein